MLSVKLEFESSQISVAHALNFNFFSIKFIRNYLLEFSSYTISFYWELWPDVDKIDCLWC